MGELNSSPLSVEPKVSTAIACSTFGRFVLLGARRGFRLANLVALVGAGIMLLATVAILAYGIVYFEGIAILAKWETWKMLGNILGFYVVTVGWGIVIGAAIAATLYGFRRLVRRGS